MPSDARAQPVAAAPASLATVGERVEQRIVALLDTELARWRAVDADLTKPLEALRDLVRAGGKRLRPAFCHWAFVGAGGDASDARVVDVGAALELLHTFALVHDDVMDGSDLRRGLPTIHRHFAAAHAASGWRGEHRRFGDGAAILVGDFAFTYADALFAAAPAAAWPVFHELRVELCVGQYLDLVGSAAATGDPVRARRIERYKSGKYTVERPLHLGAALAGRLDDLAAPLSAFGVPLGEAFQLRDDLLGAFGASEVTGKPVGDDLREGKLTPLLASALARAEGADARWLAGVGDPALTADDVGAIQRVLVSCGATTEVETTIGELVAEAQAALAAVPLREEARHALAELGTYVAWRDR